MNARLLYVAVISALFAATLGGCSEENENTGPVDTSADSETASDGDTDADSDGDTDSDNDTDVDADADSDSDADTDSDTDVDGDTDADTDTDSDVDTDTDADGDADTDGDAGDNDTGSSDAGDTDSFFSTDDICDVVEQGIETIQVRLMLLQDISSSMKDVIGTQSKWEIAGQALAEMVTQFGSDLEFGLDFFPVDGDCTVGTSVAMDAEPDNTTGIIDRLNVTELSVTTPLYLGMANFADDAYAPLFVAAGGEPYLVVISDGMDSCGTENGGVGAAELADITATLLDDQGIRTFVIGFGSGADPNQLNAIAQAGGTGRTEYFDAQDASELNDVLSSIGHTVLNNCRYELGPVDPSADINNTNIYFDENVLARGDTCEGAADWRWGNAEKSIIEFCPDVCEFLESGQVEALKVLIMCAPEDVIVV